MFSKLKTALSRLFGGRGGGESREPSAPPVEYAGYRIRPTPYRTDGRYQTAGIIEKDGPEGVKQHRFVRAETHESREDAIAFSISKGKQIIDERGDRVFA
ncbi:MAG: hypothetical protein E6G88_05335 [Alphaproteobacteria bacterium]|nr:MAG: hypothetical protein E6G88_05335 [Alphaproteobacteria bacterium]